MDTLGIFPRFLFFSSLVLRRRGLLLLFHGNAFLSLFVLFSVKYIGKIGITYIYIIVYRLRQIFKLNLVICYRNSYELKKTLLIIIDLGKIHSFSGKVCIHAIIS